MHIHKGEGGWERKRILQMSGCDVVGLCLISRIIVALYTGQLVVYHKTINLYLLIFENIKRHSYAK